MIFLAYSAGKTPSAANSAAATGRSYLVPSFRIWAGDRLTVTRLGGTAIPVFRRAVRTRSAASRTSVDRSPTMQNMGSPSQTSASTCTAFASTPMTAADKIMLNIFASSVNCNSGKYMRFAFQILDTYSIAYFHTGFNPGNIPAADAVHFFQFC